MGSRELVSVGGGQYVAPEDVKVIMEGENGQRVVILTDGIVVGSKLSSKVLTQRINDGRTGTVRLALSKTGARPHKG